VPRTRCYCDGVVTDEGFALDDVSAHLSNPDALVWIDLDSPENEELRTVADELGLHALAVEDAVQRRQRPKLDRYGDHLYVSAYAVEFDPQTGELAAHELSIFVTERALVTVRPDADFSLDRVVERWDARPELAKHGVAFLLHGLLDYLVDTHFDAVQALDEQIDDLEDQLFAEDVDPSSTHRRSFQLRKTLVRMRKVVQPMREVVNPLMRRDVDLVDDTMRPYFQDVYDNVMRATEWTESLRDMITSILETNLTLQGNRLNVITKKVTGWAAIIAVPTAVTGFYGQNLPYPGYEQVSGFIQSTVLIAGLSVGLFLLFRRNDWL
jgi:magnesium transporter